MLDDEDSIFRPPAPQPYSLPALQLRVPHAAVSDTLSLLRRAGERESGVFWYGVRDATGHGTVTYVAAPKQRMTWGNYSVSAEALAAIVHRLPDGLKPLAQVHSHPGTRVEHSNYDDKMISSRKALSLVFPSYGRTAAPFPTGVGVHEWQSNYWHLLSDTDAQKRVVTVAGVAKVEDFR